jgi:hypothetical protein
MQAEKLRLCCLFSLLALVRKKCCCPLELRNRQNQIIARANVPQGAAVPQPRRRGVACFDL